MKKCLIVFTVLLLILSLSSCGAQSGKPEEMEVNTSKVKSNVINNCEGCVIQGDRIYYANSYDNGTLYSVNTDGSDNRKLNDDWTSWFYVSGDRIYYQNGKGGKIYAMNNDGSFDAALSAAGYINDDLWQLNNLRWYGDGGHQADQWLE